MPGTPEKKAKMTQRLSRLVVSKITGHLIELSRSKDLWIPKEEVLKIIVKKEVRTMFQGEKPQAYSEANYQACLVAIKERILKY